MRFRVSNVESFRRWEADEDATVEDMLANLQWDNEASPAMIAGTAFHKALELAPEGHAADELTANDHTFVFVTDIEVELPAIRELRASKTYIVDGEPITISGQVDAIDGLSIADHKTTAYFKPDGYFEGCQWRLYLDIFGAQHFRWNVFEIAPMKEPLTYQVTEQHRLEQYRYPGMEDDCLALVTRFARFVREHLKPAPTLTELLSASLARKPSPVEYFGWQDKTQPSTEGSTAK